MLALLASGCNQLAVSRNTQSPFTADTGQAASQTTDGDTKQAPETGVAPRQAPVTQQQQIIEMGTGNYIAEPGKKAQQISENGEGDITLNFQDTDLREFIKVILSDVLDVNYFIDPNVGGKVTIETPKPISRDQVFPLLEETLATNGASIIRSAGMYRILPITEAGQGNLSPSTVQQSSKEGYSIRIIPLKYVAAQEMQKILEPYMSDSNNLRIDTKRNLVIVNGTTQELDLIQDTISIFDVDWLRGMSMGLYPLTYVDPKTLKEELDSIIGAMDTGGDNKELLGGLVRVVPVERLNSILLISSTPAALREVEIWLYRLDKPGEKAGKRLYVYNVQNAKAVDLADILGRVFTGTVDNKAPGAELAPGLKPVEIGKEEKAAGSQAAKEPTTAANGTGVTLPSSDSIEIIADDVRNALVVLATPQDYTMVEAAIQKLDVVPLQVLIEASILEVTLRDDLSYGVEWYFRNSVHSDINNATGTLDLGDAGIKALSGFSYTIVDSASNVRLALNALQNESNVNVLSSPSLMVLDNQTATINVGDEIPVPSRQSVSNLDPNAPTVNEIQYRKTGVTLEVTPRVNSGGLVTMEVKQEVSSAVTTTTSDIDAPTIQNRLIDSVVAINSGETIILGGLIQDTKTNSEGGVPFIHRIPVVGKLFGRTTQDSNRTELLVLITPRVVGSRNDARQITDEFRRKLKGIAPIKKVPEDKS